MTGPRTRRSAPVVPQATTAGKSWDRRCCHARPNSRLAFNRTHKADYRDQDHLWSGRFKYISGCPHRPRGEALRVESNAEGLAELAAFCGDHQVELVVMEATGGTSAWPSPCYVMGGWCGLRHRQSAPGAPLRRGHGVS